MIFNDRAYHVNSIHCIHLPLLYFVHAPIFHSADPISLPWILKCEGTLLIHCDIHCAPNKMMLRGEITNSLLPG